ncbi:hypothetical protein [Streptomyces pristinaespiralis]|uniref:hypothetical protein n=1 Tax=Streptomyces pristinaespiralis TaxID=38300 RepID=UPI0033EE777A
MNGHDIPAAVAMSQLRNICAPSSATAANRPATPILRVHASRTCTGHCQWCLLS